MSRKEIVAGIGSRERLRFHAVSLELWARIFFPRRGSGGISRIGLRFLPVGGHRAGLKGEREGDVSARWQRVPVVLCGGQEGVERQ